MRLSQLYWYMLLTSYLKWSYIGLNYLQIIAFYIFLHLRSLKFFGNSVAQHIEELQYNLAI